MSQRFMSDKHVAFIGLGSIGLPIAINLQNAGYKLNIYSRSGIVGHSKFINKASIYESPSNVVNHTNLLILCVTDEKAVEDILFSSNGLYKNLRPNSTVLDLSTISPECAVSFSKRLSKRDIRYIDAPVTGGTKAAEEGALTILLGATEGQSEHILPVLNVIGSSIHYFNNVGQAQQVKAINQVLVAGSYMAVAEAIALASSKGLPLSKVVNSLLKGAGGSWALQNRSRNMIEGNFPLGFKISLHHKDLSIALKMAKDSKLNLPITKNVYAIEEELINLGCGNDDVSALVKFMSVET